MADDERILIVPDIHQDFQFLEVALGLGREKEVSEILFLGDIVDAKQARFANEKALARTLRTLCEVLEGPIPTVLLMGNHDADQILFAQALRNLPGATRERALRGAGPVGETARTLAASPDWPVVQGAQQYAVARGRYLITHAGAHPGILPEPDWDAGAVADYFNREAPNRLKDLLEEPTLGPGKCRGGFLPRGGILWQDFEQEFEDSCPFPQIVGHTIGPAARNCGRSWCLDARQTTVALLSPEGLEPVRLFQ